ncbi:aminotransferase class V-fold PLP-dependent enzyme [Diaminobutyricibacter tongyongensis]|uniref:Aminotransferase class V-fold PLP-dependent enzyme n=1 Tax=Leifsonia tongyongensis TaxID=1268043 RepID=A0A6L9XVS3_9MICO|nr:aminotransferase class V-fold PLP-dependent enzyme [Diaminobutyricibacter tongyongensis]
MTAPADLLTREGRPARTEWTLDPAVTHLNHGSFGAVPIAAQEVQRAFIEAMEANPSTWFKGLPARVAAARREVEEFLGAEQDSLGLVPNASAGATVVFSSIHGFPGMEVVTTDHAYGAVAMGAERLARRWDGAVIDVHVPLAAGAKEVEEAVMAHVGPRTALIVIDAVTSATARRFPIANITTAARRIGVPVLVDAAHAPGVFAEPLGKMDGDFWVGNLHKFACAPRGTAALVVAEGHRADVSPLIDSWGAPYPFPASFDHQGTLDNTGHLAAGSAFGTIEERFGWGSVLGHMDTLGDYAEDIVGRSVSDLFGFDARVDVGMPVGAMRLIRLPKGLVTTPEEAEEFRAYLSDVARVETAITCWNGSGFLRLSVHAYNTAGDYEDFAERVVPLFADFLAVRR